MESYRHFFFEISFLIYRQNPQLVGNNKHYIVFGDQLKVPTQNHTHLRLRLDNSGQYILDAGSADGVCPGAEFTVYADHGGFPKLPNLGVMVPTVVDNQNPPIISAIIDLLFLLLELMRTSYARLVAKFQ